MAIVLPQGKQQFFDSNGDPLVGGKLYTWAPGAGITTPKTTHQDAAGAVPNANPIILNARGEAMVFWTGGYNVKLEDSAGNLIYTVENINIDASAATLDAALRADLANFASSTKGLALLSTFVGAFGYPANTQGQFLSYTFGRSTAEISAGVTPTNYAYFVGSPKRYGALADWNGTTGTDDSTAIRNAFLVVQAAGGGTVDFGTGRYRIFSNGSTGVLADLTSTRGVRIEAQGAELVVDRTFTGVQTVTLFQFTTCNGIAFGDFVATCTQTQPFGQKTLRGPRFAYFLNGCQNVSSRSLKLTSFRIGFDCYRATGEALSYATRNCDFGLIDATNTGYPLQTASSGYGLTARIKSNTCGRSFFPQGIRDAEVWVNSKNHEASADVLIATDQSEGAYSLKLHYSNRESTTADNSINCVRIEFQDGDTVGASIQREIEIDLDIQTTDTAWLGYGFAVGKVLSSDLPDPDPRGHTLAGIKVSGLIRGGSGGAANQRSVALCNVGTWTSAEFVSGIDFTNLRCEFTAQPSFNFASLTDRATIQNFYSTTQVNITGGPGIVDVLGSSTAATWVYTGKVRFDGAFRGSATYNPASLAAGATQQTSVTVTGAVVGDVADASFSIADVGILWLGEVTAADTATVTMWNTTAGAIDLGSGTVRAAVFKAL